ncbi:hypothetical protein ACM26V_07810 [Salipaludibacillus sp. HK11]|uniref:hypothetical protein n=1 Tax=Salipaludibacillus sp. HK11 TaxID=3394320 RepID=UPI0039FDE076
MNYKKLINRHADNIVDYKEIGPYETLNTLHVRSKLHKEYQKLTREEKRLLATVDLKTLQKIECIHEFLSGIYDFSKSKEPKEQWWWHIDKVISGEIKLSSYPQNVLTKY